MSANGAFGGPVAVAVGQTQALAELGYDVTLMAGWDGHARLTVPRVNVQLFRARHPVPGNGFAGTFSLPAALIVTLCGRPLVVRTHGMVRSDDRMKARAVDALLTRRVLQHSAAQLVLTEDEEADATLVAGKPLNTVRVAIGVVIPDLSAAWDGTSLPEVVFCARRHERKRPVSFVHMAAAFLKAGGAARFTMYGQNEGELPAVMEAIEAHGLGSNVKYLGALAPVDVLPQLSMAQAYVLPSLNEQFPMSPFEAMSLGLPAVIADSTGVSALFESSGAAEVTDGTPESMADALHEVLASWSAWQSRSSRARHEIAEHFRADSVARPLARSSTTHPLYRPQTKRHHRGRTALEGKSPAELYARPER